MGSFSDWCLPTVPRLLYRPTQSCLNGSQFVNIDISARSDYLVAKCVLYIDHVNGRILACPALEHLRYCVFSGEVVRVMRGDGAPRPSRALSIIISSYRDDDLTRSAGPGWQSCPRVDFQVADSLLVTAT